METYFQKEDDRPIVELLRTNTKRYIEIFAELAEQLMPKRQKPYDPEDVSFGGLRKFGTNSKIFSKSKEGKTLTSKAHLFWKTQKPFRSQLTRISTLRLFMDTTPK